MKETILITGASSGIGFKMAEILATNYRLIMVARNKRKLEEAAALIRTLHPNAQILTHHCDLAVRFEVENLFDSLQEQKIEIDMLVNNAGIGVYGKFTETRFETEWEMIQVNVAGLYTMSKLFGCEMAKRKKGKILNVASLLSHGRKKFRPFFLSFIYFPWVSACKYD